MEGEDTKLEQRAILFHQLRDGPVEVLALKQGHHAQQPGIIWAWQCRQCARAPVDAVRAPEAAGQACGDVLSHGPQAGLAHDAQISTENV